MKQLLFVDQSCDCVKKEMSPNSKFISGLMPLLFGLALLAFIAWLTGFQIPVGWTADDGAHIRFSDSAWIWANQVTKSASIEAIRV